MDKALATDIDDLKQITAQIAVEISNPRSTLFHFMSLIFDNLQSLVYMIDKDLQVLYVNKSLIKRMRLYKPDADVTDFIGKSCYKLIDLEAPCEKCTAKDAIAQRKVVSTEIEAPYSKKKMRATCIPLVYDGVSGAIIIAFYLEEQSVESG